MISVYHLFDTVIFVPIYVGATKNLKTRLANHAITTLKGYRNIESVIIEEICLCKSDKDANEKEKILYDCYIRQGYALLNKSEKFYRVPVKSKYTQYQIGALADAFDKSLLTIQRWIAKKDDRLTSEKAKSVLMNHLPDIRKMVCKCNYKDAIRIKK